MKFSRKNSRFEPLNQVGKSGDVRSSGIRLRQGHGGQEMPKALWRDGAERRTSRDPMIGTSPYDLRVHGEPRPPKLDPHRGFEPELALGAALRIDGDCGLPLRQFIGGEGRGEVALQFMGSSNFQNWIHIGALNRSWFLTLPNALRAAMDSLSANLIGGEGRGEVALWFMEMGGCRPIH
jgi:hypothetical protein